jgi:hypothetical protein
MVFFSSLSNSNEVLFYTLHVTVTLSQTGN